MNLSNFRAQQLKTDRRSTLELYIFPEGPQTIGHLLSLCPSAILESGILRSKVACLLSEKQIKEAMELLCAFQVNKITDATPLVDNMLPTFYHAKERTERITNWHNAGKRVLPLPVNHRF